MSIQQFIWRQLVRLKNPSCRIDAGILARDVVFEKNVTIEQGSYIGARRIGKYSFIGMNSYIDKSTASIGRFCSIAMNARISLNNHPLDRVTTHPFTYHKKYGFVTETEKIAGINDKQTVIGNDVWIGANVTILAGVTVGDGAVIGANALVTKDVEPYSIVSGSPAAHIRYRFDEALRTKLLASQWWNWEEGKIRKHIAEFRNPEQFVSLL